MAKVLRDSASIKGVFQEERYDPMQIAEAQQKLKAKKQDEINKEYEKTVTDILNNKADGWLPYNVKIQGVYEDLAATYTNMRRSGIDNVSAIGYTQGLINYMKSIEAIGKDVWKETEKIDEMARNNKDRPNGYSFNKPDVTPFIKGLNVVTYDDLSENQRTAIDKTIPAELVKYYEKNGDPDGRLAFIRNTLAKKVYYDENKPKYWTRDAIDIAQEVKKIMPTYEENKKSGVSSGGGTLIEESMTESNYEKFVNAAHSNVTIREQALSEITGGAINDSEDAMKYAVQDKDGRISYNIDGKIYTQEQIDAQIDKYIPERVVNKTSQIKDKSGDGDGGGSGSDIDLTIKPTDTRISFPYNRKQEGTDILVGTNRNMTAIDSYSIPQLKFQVNTDIFPQTVPEGSSDEFKVTETFGESYFTPSTLSLVEIAKEDIVIDNYEYRESDGRIRKIKYTIPKGSIVDADITRKYGIKPDKKRGRIMASGVSETINKDGKFVKSSSNIFWDEKELSNYLTKFPNTKAGREAKQQMQELYDEYKLKL